MRMRNPKYKDEVINNCQFLINKEINFAKEQPICIEIGMGKGNFILNMALNNPDKNFIGIEKYSSVAAVAIKKIMNYNLPNLKVIISDILNLEELLANKVEVIYLNFSDPWPKNRHERRRLTSQNFLSKYDSLFRGEKRILVKTDNRHLFEFSLKAMTDYGYQIEKVCLDVYEEELEGNIPTEYERKFHEKGFPIYFLEAVNNGRNNRKC